MSLGAVLGRRGLGGGGSHSHIRSGQRRRLWRVVRIREHVVQGRVGEPRHRTCPPETIRTLVNLEMRTYVLAGDVMRLLHGDILGETDCGDESGDIDDDGDRPPEDQPPAIRDEAGAS